MDISIRNIESDDATAIAKLSDQLGYHMSVEKTAGQITTILTSHNDLACVAVSDGKIAGWIHVFYTHRIESPSFCEIGGLVVNEQYRGKGIGKLLIAHTKAWCKLKKCDILKVRSNIKRNEAHRFYSAAGFAEIKQQKVFEITL